MAEFKFDSSGWADAFNQPTAEPYDPEEHGFFRDLFEDIKNVITGLPRGIQTIFTQNPITTFKQIGKAYDEYYSPIFHGDFSNLWNHPFQVLTDVATVAMIPFTGGASVVARAGLKALESAAKSTGMSSVATMALKAEKAVQNSRLNTGYILRNPGDLNAPDMTIPLSPNAYTRFWQKASRNTLKRVVPPSFPVIGETSRYTKAIKKYEFQPMFERLIAEPVQLEAMAYRAKPHQKVAATLAVMLGGGRGREAIDSYVSWLRKNEKVDDTFIEMVQSEKVLKEYSTPSPQTLALTEKLRHVAELDTYAKVLRGELTRETAIARPWNVLRMISGAKHIDANEVPVQQAALTQWTGELDNIIKRHEAALRRAEARSSKKRPGKNAGEDLRDAAGKRADYVEAYDKAEQLAYGASKPTREALASVAAVMPLARSAIENRVKIYPAMEGLQQLDTAIEQAVTDLKSVIENKVPERVVTRHKRTAKPGKPSYDLEQPGNVPGETFVSRSGKPNVYETSRSTTRALTNDDFVALWRKYTGNKGKPRTGKVLNDQHWGEQRNKLIEQMYHVLKIQIAKRDEYAALLHGTTEEAILTEGRALTNLLEVLQKDVAERSAALGAAKTAKKELDSLIESHKAAVLKTQQERAELMSIVHELDERSVAGLAGGTPLSELAAQFRSNNWDIPVYFPNLPELLPIIMQSHGLAPGVARRLKPNKGILAAAGRVALDPRNMSRSYFLTVREAMKDNMHDWALTIGKRVPATYHLQADEMFVKVHKKANIPGDAGHPEMAYNRLPHPVDQAAGPFNELVDVQRTDALDIPVWQQEVETAKQLLPKSRSKRVVESVDTDEAFEKKVISKPDEIFTRFPEEAHPSFVGDDAYYYVVKKRDAKALVGEWHDQHKVINWLYTKPTGAWRVLVLGLRPAFFVNNMVGNLFLHALSFNGIESLRGIAEQIFVKDWKHIPMSEKRRMKFAAERAGFEELLWMWYPDQMRATFGMHATEGTGLGSKVANIDWNNNPLSLLPITQHLAERALRKAQIRNEIRRAPEVREVYKNMPKQTRDWWDAADTVFEKNPQVRNRIAQEVNNALGDYINMSFMERHLIRQVWPFYAWYKAIGLIALRMPFHHPLKLKVMQQVGQLGAEYQADKYGSLPSFLAGAIGLGAADWLGILPGDFPEEAQAQGREMMLLTSSINPFQTVVEELEAIESLFSADSSGRSASILAGINPILQGVLEATTGRSLLTGAPIDRAPGLIPGATSAFINSIPQVTILRRWAGGSQGSEKSLYMKNLHESILSFLGVPVRATNLNTAKYIQLLESGQLEQQTITVNPKPEKEFSF